MAGRIHIYGVGAVGLLIAHSLRRLASPPPVSLLLRNNLAVDRFKGEFRSQVAIEREHQVSYASGFDVGSLHDTADTERIDKLVLAVKTPGLTDLQVLARRLDRDSTVLLVQNGLGVLEAVQSYFSASTRPSLVLGVNSHGVLRHNYFRAEHTGLGTLRLGAVPREGGPAAGVAELVRTLEQCQALAAVDVGYDAVVLAQMEKVVVNACINPLTAIYDVRNGALVGNVGMAGVVRAVVAESVAVLRALYATQFPGRDLAAFDAVIEPGRLTGVVYDVATATAANSSSMRVDVRAGRTTEIEAINGFLVRTGRALGVRARTNALLAHMVAARLEIERAAAAAALPDE
ncbi:ketopantoate reductase PanE/ApbA C terminal-domain-containing protein [Dipodascopsis tothii]|uniref:ketopantoate reductase PanE/ApbA C terminal-domain-containing protein n=1 Tax=Dipodascopsis tothii TaxID=44089 RepID=UPI0034CF4126